MHSHISTYNIASDHLAQALYSKMQKTIASQNEECFSIQGTVSATGGAAGKQHPQVLVHTSSPNVGLGHK